MKKKIVMINLVLAMALVLALTSFALAEYSVEENLELYPNWIGEDAQGLPTTMPIFTYNAAGYINEAVWVEVPCDTDRDGVRDRVSVYIRRPNAPGFKAPAVMEFSPYHEGTVGYTRFNTYINSDDPHLKALAQTFRYHDNYPLEIAINPDTTHLTYDDVKYKGDEAWDIGKWWTSNAILSDSWYTDNVPPATEPTSYTNIGSSPASYTALSRHQHYFTRGYAMLYGQLLGSRTSTGITNALHIEEWLSVAAVSQWLRGEAQAFTTRTGTVAVVCDWANGNIALDGTSYPGTTPLVAAMTTVPGVKAIMPEANVESWYDYYRAGGAVNSPIGYGGEDMNLHASFNFSRFNADTMVLGIIAIGIPPAAGPGFDMGAQLAYIDVQQHLMQVQDRVTGDYNVDWDVRNLTRGFDKINPDVGILQTSGLMDWNVKPKHAFAVLQGLRDKFEGNHKYVGGLTVHASQNGRLVPGKDGVERGMLKWYLMFMDHHLLGLDNKVDELMYDVNIPHNRTGVMEGYDYDVNVEERGTIIPGTTYQKIYLTPAEEGKAGRLSYYAPAEALESFADMPILEQLGSPTPQGSTALSTANRTAVPANTGDGNYRVVPAQAAFCEERFIGLSRSSSSLAGLEVIDYVDRPVDGRLMYISEPLTERLLLSGTVTVHLNAAPDRGTGNISAALIEIGRIPRTDTTAAEGRTALSVSTTGSTQVFPTAGGVSAVNATRYSNPVYGSANTNYKWVTWGHGDVQNPSYDGKAWYDVPEHNYVPDFYFQTTLIEPGEFYNYVIEMDPYNYVFEAGTRIGVMVYGTDPNYSPLLTPECTAAFDIQLGEGSFVKIPLKLAEPKDAVTIEAGSDDALKRGSETDIPYSIADNTLGFNALELELPFISSIYAPIDVTASALLGGADLGFSIVGNTLKISIAADANIIGDGELFTVTYKVAAKAPYVFTTPLNIKVVSATFASFMDKIVDVDVDTVAGSLSSELVSLSPNAYVTKLNGNKNDLTIYFTEYFVDGSTNNVFKTFSIDNNAAANYLVQGLYYTYTVYVDTKGNTQIRACEIIS